MVGLDVTTRVIQKKPHLDEICNSGTPSANVLKQILPCYRSYFEKQVGINGIHTHDPSAIAYLIDRKLFRTENWPIFVETEGHCAGQTIPDYHHIWGSLPGVEVCLGVDAPGVLEILRKRMTR
jgi:inosine-uridine nucleoside N-ribohydrolase